MIRTLTWFLGVARPCVLGAVLWMAGGGAWGQATPRALSVDALSKAPPPSAAAGMRGLRSTPCYAIQSSLNPIGDSYAPLAGCPGYANTP